LREFFWSKNFIEVHAQNRLSILATCEDPFNVQTFNYTGKVCSLVQTGQMWLEYEILTKPDVADYFV
jgi:aspartyl/asparaginyl-tRNA synthetase